MKLLTLKQYMNMSKPALIRKIMKTLKVMPKAKLARLCYNITKSKLPWLRTKKQKTLPIDQNKNWDGTKTLKEIWGRWLKNKGIYHDGTKKNWVHLSHLEGFSPNIANKFWLKKGGTKSETSTQRIERVYGKRKFSRKQLAAQRLFAKRARAGTLRRWSGQKS